MAAGDRSVLGETKLANTSPRNASTNANPRLEPPGREAPRGPARGQAREQRLDQFQALADLGDANPDAGVDVAGLARRDLERQRVIRRIGRSRRASKSRPEARPTTPPRRTGAQDRPGARRSRPCGPGARPCCRKAARAWGRSRAASATAPGSPRRLRRRDRRATPPGTTASIISRWPNAALAARKVRSRKIPQWASIRAKAASLQIAPMSPK